MELSIAHVQGICLVYLLALLVYFICALIPSKANVDSDKEGVKRTHSTSFCVAIGLLFSSAIFLLVSVSVLPHIYQTFVYFLLPVSVLFFAIGETQRYTEVMKKTKIVYIGYIGSAGIVLSGIMIATGVIGAFLV